MKILVVDDETDCLELFSQILEDSQWQSFLCDSPLKALELMKTEKFDAIVTDVQMPQMDGFSLICAIRQIDLKVPVLVITGCESQLLPLKAIENGVHDFFTKPLNLKEIRQTLDFLTHSLKAE